MRLTALILLLAGCNGAKNDPATCWYCLETSDDGGPGNKGGGDDDDDDDGEAFAEWWGELDSSTGMGLYGFFKEGNGTCDLDYEITDAVPADCAECVFSWEITLGEPEVWENKGNGCKGALNLAGTTVRVGHVDPEALWSDDGGWTEVGWSEHSGGEWFFSIE